MNRKLIWKFNIIDLLIIGILLLGVAALIYRAVIGGSEGRDDFEITYVCSAAPTELLYEVHDGMLCVDGDSGAELGSVSEVNVEEQTSGSGEGRGTIKTLVSGSKTEHGITVDDTAYLRGKTLNLIVDDLVFEVYISNIQEK